MQRRAQAGAFLRPREQLWLLCTLIAIPSVLWGMWQVQRFTLSRTSAALSRAAGRPVTIESISATLEPGIALHGLRVGSELHVERADAVLEFAGLRPQLKGLRLTRPQLTFDLEKDRRRSTTSLLQGGQVGRRTRFLKRQPGRLPPISIHEGRVELKWKLGDVSLDLHSDDVHLLPQDDGYRFVTGKSDLRLGSMLLAELQSFAADLDPEHGFKPTRAALLAGEVRLATYPLALRVLKAHASRQGNTIELQLHARAPGSGKITLSGQIVEAPHAMASTEMHTIPRARDVLRASLEDVSLQSLAPLLSSMGVDVQKAKLLGTLTLSRMGKELQLDADLQIEGSALLHRRLAPHAVPLPRLKLELHLLRSPEGTWTLMDSRVALPKLALYAKGSFTPRTRRLSLALRLPPTGCQTTLTGLPEALVPSLRGMHLRGEFGATLDIDVDLADIKAGTVGFDLTPFTCKVLVDSPGAAVKKLIRGAPSQWIRLADGGRRQRQLGRRSRDFLPLHRISRHVRAAFVVAEDTHFYQHHGFALRQIKRALLHNLAQRRVERGASTISQQVVKNLFLNHERSVSRKLQEAVITWRLEQLTSKGRILELYLNLVEMGPGIYGVEQAARHYFGKSATALTPLQAVHLAALTPSPRRLGVATPDAAWMKRLQMLLRMMWRSGYLAPSRVRRYRPSALGLVKRASEK
ncbi:MAG: transglycosylase domain-containing protein [Deltaproteobacteria bacterium]|nr:transglycosylase domain-containing protein [Deltaproteobacteria bacterium]